MIRPYKGRSLQLFDRVEVYLNLNIEGVFSIRNAKTGLVVAHGNNFVVSDGEAIVQESGRQKVLDTGVKNVHAFIRGIYVGPDGLWRTGFNDMWEEMQQPIRYNPLYMSKFQFYNGTEVNKSDFLFKSDGKAYSLNF